MAGHSKWKNIQHRKGRQDEKRGKIWTRVIREIMVAARTGGGGDVFPIALTQRHPTNAVLDGVGP